MPGMSVEYEADESLPDIPQTSSRTQPDCLIKVAWSLDIRVRATRKLLVAPGPNHRYRASRPRRYSENLRLDQSYGKRG